MCTNCHGPSPTALIPLSHSKSLTRCLRRSLPNGSAQPCSRLMQSEPTLRGLKGCNATMVSAFSLPSTAQHFQPFACIVLHVSFTLKACFDPRTGELVQHLTRCSVVAHNMVCLCPAPASFSTTKKLICHRKQVLESVEMYNTKTSERLGSLKAQQYIQQSEAPRLGTFLGLVLTMLISGCFSFFCRSWLLPFRLFQSVAAQLAVLWRRDSPRGNSTGTNGRVCLASQRRTRVTPEGRRKSNLPGVRLRKPWRPESGYRVGMLDCTDTRSSETLGFSPSGG